MQIDVQKPADSVAESEPRQAYLERVARSLAEAHAPANLASGRSPRSLPTSSFEKRFERIFGVLARLDSAELEKLPGIEWLLDNDYVVQEAISAVTEDTPDDGYRRLPMLATAPRRGELRVLALADEIMNICGTPMELSWVERFLSAYQTDAELSLGELWALPNMLRSVALERLANATQSLVSEASDEAVAVPDYSEAIASHVINLRNLATQDWTAFVEAVSQVHEILVHDPVGAYAQMDTATRNRYRHRVEVIARRTGCLESAVARQAVALGEDLQADAPERHRHVGFYLIDGGLLTLVESLKHGRRWIFALSAWLERHTGWWYLGSIVTVTASITWWVARFLPPGAMSYVLLLPITLVLSLTASVSFVHWLVGLWHKPQALPKLDFKAGLPVAHATAVVTPAMLSSRSEIEHLLECAEKNYLGNSDPALRYALLTDFIDADTMHDEADDALLSFAVQTVESLNARHGTDLLRPFFLFHRQREWSEREGCYMGRERKRGKLAEFNSLLLGNRAAESALVVGDADHLRGIRFVITLDADTQLPPGSANALVGVLAHPLNQPVLEGPCVTAGYSVIQPRLSVDPEIANSNPFTRAFAGDVVLDLYSHAVSDVYQDLFEVGIFVGKGIYDVRAFEQTLEGRVPDNAILSHDLFEGLHGRVGLATDITLFEDYPVDLLTFARRAHRWIRGDWQLLPWLAPFVPAQRGFVRNRFTLLDRWKLFDNLRQSLLAPATLLALVAGWTLLPGMPWVWTLGILTLSAAPIAFGSVHALGSGIAQGGTPRAMVEHLALAMPREGARWLFSLAYLPYENFMNLDAIARTLWRLTVSRRHLLQWQPAALAMRDVAARLSDSYVWRRMLAAPLTALAVGGGVAWVQPTALWVAGPFLALWFVAPQIAIASTKRRAHAATDEHAATSAQKRLLRKVALRTWQFFEHFVGPDTHWLPPDNYHEAPETFVSKRTSPTNIGLMLLATVAAYDLGHLGLTTLVPRLRYTFESLKRLQRYRGHFLNWYRIDDLTALEPRYVSTVDSGNLAASLIALKSALLEIDHAPVPLTALVEGTVDILRELKATLDSAGASDRVRARIDVVIDRLSAADATSGQLASVTEIEQTELATLQSLVLEAVNARADNVAPEELDALRRGFNLLRGQVEAFRHQCVELMPWRMWADQLADDASGEINGTYHSICATLTTVPDFASIPKAYEHAGAALGRLQKRIAAKSTGRAPELAARLHTMREDLHLAARRVQALRKDIAQLVSETDALLLAMDFAFLYDRNRHLLRLGYTVSTGEYDTNHYDLLASEARLASFVAIVKGDVPPEHWLYLGRPFTRVGSQRVLASWSATAFEYLMPHLLMRAPPESLLAQSCRIAVKQQRAFADRFEVPWGISESAFYQLDAQAHYQYRAFGVPGLGLRREQRFRLVIAPYASLLALPFFPQSVISNLEALESLKMLGRFGLFEAVDFGLSDADPRRANIVFSYMSHHQGMILTALDNALEDGAMVRRFHADPSVASHVNLLFEQMPRGTSAPIGWRGRDQDRQVTAHPTTLESWSVSSRTEVPQLNVLSNGHYQVLLNHFGIGMSSFDGLCLARWQPDPCDHSGTCFYLRDLDSGALWSAGARPIGVRNPNDCDARFWPHMAEFHRRDHGVHSRVEVVVAANEDVEIRRVTLTNDTDKPKRLEVVSYAEPVLANLEDHERHPAFSKLFIEISVVQPNGVLLARRRPREANESPIYLAHSGYEFGQRRQQRNVCLDRREFLGRWGSVGEPAWLAAPPDQRQVSNDSFDPVMALGIEVELPPRAMTQLVFVYAAGRSRAEVVQPVAAYQSKARVDWAFHQARLRAERILAEVGIDPPEVASILELLSGVYALEPRLRGSAESLAGSQAIQSMLWSRGISGDLPILMLRVRGLDDVRAAEQLVRAHTFWDRQQIALDLIIVDAEMGGYAQPTRTRLARVVEDARRRRRHDTQGNIYVVPIAELGAGDRRRILAAAWLMLDPTKGTMVEQLRSIRHRLLELPPFVPMPGSPIIPEPNPELERPANLRFDNGLGGFTPDGTEYVVFLSAGQTTPAPWSNVIANPDFGFLITDSGSSTTWAESSGENRLTPWRNDPVSDPSGEAVFLRDEETGAVWSPTPRPRPNSSAYEIHHGAGYTTFEHISHGLRQSLRVFADTADPVKIASLRLTNCWQRPRRITVTYYAEWVLGIQGARRPPYVVSEFDPNDSVVYARNAFARDGTRTAFLTSGLPVHGVTTDRREFLGLDGDPSRPAALFRIGLSGAVTPGADPCAALQVHVNVEPGATVKVHFALGQGRDRHHAQDLVRRYRQSAEAVASLARVNAHWGDVLGGLDVTTPDPGLDLMANRWLLYQALSSRLWGRAALYQSGGGFGFRDQLQDVMAFAAVQPELAREQIVRAAGVQFYRGDVLHWWHDNPLRGVRTRCSDDMLWLPYVTAHYLTTSGDASILDERVAYLDGPELAPDEGERYAEYGSTQIDESIYEHCLQAIEHAAGKTGPHGLPLIGSGDWNDGLNRVGVQGRGESVWLGWFLTVVYRDFAAVCDRVGDTDTGADYRTRANALVERVEAVAWDGEWYLRAYDDDGHPLGSAGNDECKIDLNAQTWSVLADAPNEVHRLQAMRAVKRHLMDEGHILRLLTPPFQRGDSDPGYIKGYPPGVRENGAQYSHAAVWAGFAYGKLGDGDGVLEVAHCLNPINHTASPEAVATYRVEPYVVAADIYSEPPNSGRGGWTWYTGAAAWTYRLIVEVILGIRRRGDGFEVAPCLPSDWEGYEARLRVDDAEHQIRVVHEGAQQYRVYVDGALLPDGRLTIATQRPQDIDAHAETPD